MTNNPGEEPEVAEVRALGQTYGRFRLFSDVESDVFAFRKQTWSPDAQAQVLTNPGVLQLRPMFRP
ncbi:hypothetical protein AA13594_1802 [Gluconacetobacter azotocaptans DSM 13594]|nr:hypothetical protein AA13594_1802 [Gluconacetobacter azotocaptans DSM 13594]